jgi:hypothetical protein
MHDQFDQTISLTKRNNSIQIKRTNNVYANHIVFSIDGLKSIFIV